MDGNSGEAERSFSTADFRRRFGFEEIGRSGADDAGGAVGFEQHRGIFVNGDGADLGGPTVLQNAGDENEQAAETVTFGEMSVGDHAGQQRNAQEIAGERDFVAVRIGQGRRENEWCR